MLVAVGAMSIFTAAGFVTGLLVVIYVRRTNTLMIASDE